MMIRTILLLSMLSSIAHALRRSIDSTSFRHHPVRVFSRHNATSPALVDFMTKAFAKIIRIRPMVDSTLALDGHVLNLADDNLIPFRITSDGTDGRAYALRDGPDGATVHVMKTTVGPTIASVTLHDHATGETVQAELMFDGDYAAYSTRDMDPEAMAGWKVRMVEAPKATSIGYSERDSEFDSAMTSDTAMKSGLRKYSERDFDTPLTGRGRSLRSSSKCETFTAIRMDVRFDSAFCSDHGGDYNKTVDKIHAIIAQINMPYNLHPLCVKVVTCDISGYCDPSADPHKAAIDRSDSVCGGDDGMLLEQFRKQIYPDGKRHRDVYPEGQCDVTHLFYGSASRDPFPESTIGCAYGALCWEFAVGVDQVGSRSGGTVAQAAIVAHELGHNFGANHDQGYGYMMFRSICPSCTSFSPESIEAMTGFIERNTRPQCLAEAKAEAAASCRGMFTDRKSCNGKRADYKCTWRNDECVPRAELGCGDHTLEGPCMWHGQNCVWMDGRCREQCEGLSESSCDNQRDGYCTWRPEDDECTVRHKLRCPKYADETRCEEHGTFCKWDEGECRHLKRSDVTAQSARDRLSCDGIYSELFCLRDKLELCSWNAVERKCAKRSSIRCRHFGKRRSCLEHGDDCAWASASSTCRNRRGGQKNVDRVDA